MTPTDDRSWLQRALDGIRSFFGGGGSGGGSDPGLSFLAQEAMLELRYNRFVANGSQNGLLFNQQEDTNAVIARAAEGATSAASGMANAAMLPLGGPEIKTAEEVLIEGKAVAATGEKVANTVLEGAEAARAAMGKGPNALPGAALTDQMRSALQSNLESAQKMLDPANQGMNRAGNAVSPDQAARAASAAQNRINTILQVLQSGIQSPRN